VYTAAVLDKNSQLVLKEVLAENLDFESNGYVFRSKTGDLPHHMTINLGQFDSKLNPPEFRGCQSILRVSRFLYDDDVCCAEVDTAVAIDINSEGLIDSVCDIYTINDERSRPHITMCLRPPARPVQSNLLFAQESNPAIIELEEPIVLVASIRVCS